MLLSPETHARLAEMTNKKQIFNDVITELLNMKIRAEGLQGNRIPAQTPVAPASRGGITTPWITGRYRLSVIKTSQEVYQKTSNILRAIENKIGHCLSILKSGLGNQPKPTDGETTNPVTSRIDHV